MMDTKNMGVVVKPFILYFVRPIEKSAYNQAIREKEALTSFYDPMAQISRILATGGTELTYDSTTSGLFPGTDDSYQTDT